MSIFKSNTKIKNIDRQEIVNVICELERRQEGILNEIEANKTAVSDLIYKGQNEHNKTMQLVYAKKIASMQRESERIMSRLNTIIAEIENYNQLLIIKDDYNFANETPTSGLRKLFANPGKLSNEVKRVHLMRTKNEERLTKIAGVFNDAEESYLPHEEIHGVTDDVNEIMAMFEKGAALKEEEQMYKNDEKGVDDDSAIPLKE
jgi:Asp-tRNA(Asn)/Glu-tRNA(Gln) amidotransferase C subunit